MYQNLSTRYDWPFKKVIVDLPITMKGHLKRTSGNSLSPLECQNKEVKLSLEEAYRDGLLVCDAGYTVVRFRWQLRLSLHVFTYKGLTAAQWRLSEYPGF